MATEVTGERTAAMYCTTTGRAFGPVARRDQLRRFLAWLDESYSDARSFEPDDLEALFTHWQQTHNR